ncbi:MAG: N-acetylmuramoyl-L-alanine amidase [Chloroflexota bacterium]
MTRPAQAYRPRRAWRLARLITLAVAGLAIVAAAAVACGNLRLGAPPGVVVPAGAPLPLVVQPESGAPNEAPLIAISPPGGALVQPGFVRIPKPTLSSAPRRVGIQIGHWKTDQAPEELRNLITQTGTSWANIDEVDVSEAIALRVQSLLSAQGIVVDLLPATVPSGYLADVFLALHADGDDSGEASGFKIAHGTRRGPYETDLVATLREVYASQTGLAWDDNISSGMRGYYAFSWLRYQHAVAPHTPAAILEMGFLSNNDDRHLLAEHPDTIASAIASGLLRFLEAYPRPKLFGQDLVVPTSVRRPSPSP